MIKYEEAIETLCEMFPDYDLDVIKAVLRANRGHFENTIDQLLQLKPAAATAAAASSVAPSPAAASVSSGASSSSESSSAQSQRSSNAASSSVQHTMSREEQIAYDEALAREMQRRILIAQGYRVPARSQIGPMYQAYQRQAVAAGAGTQRQQRRQQQNPENYEEVDVLQDLKESMSRMSDAAKLKFREWWSKFSSPSNQNGGGGKYSALSQNDDDDDVGDDDEEVMFDSRTLSKRSGTSNFYDTSDAPYGGDDGNEGGIELVPASTFSTAKSGNAAASSSSASSKKKD